MDAAVWQYNAVLAGHGSIAVKRICIDCSMEVVTWVAM